MNIRDKIHAAKGCEPVDLLIDNARIVDVFSGEIRKDAIAVHEGYVVGFGRYGSRETVDLEGRFASPGFIDAHVHIESAMLSVTEFARTVLPRGTTTVVADPHEIANVHGVEGIEYMLRSRKGQPIDVCYMLPSCVPATHLETSGAILSAEDMVPLLGDPHVLGLAEMMNFPGVLSEDESVLRKITETQIRRKPVDGHAPHLSGRDLAAYVSAGVGSDHECTTVEEAREKLQSGMHIMIREGTGAKNLRDLLPIVNAKTYRRAMWCTDDRHPHDILSNGHIDALLRQAISLGLDPITAIQMATLNPAEYFRLNDAGAIAPGRRADIVVFSDLNAPYAEMVFSGGVRSAENGAMLPSIPPVPLSHIAGSMHVDISGLDFSIPAVTGKVRVIGIVADQIVTEHRTAETVRRNGMAVSDPAADLLKIVVVERHGKTGRTGMGFVSGIGLRAGAIASSVAHDSHNIIATGVDDADIKAAVAEVVRMGGGLAVVADQTVRASMALPIAGLMSESPVGTVCRQMDRLADAARGLGARPTDPFMTLSFLALPVIPKLKITDKGLVDVEKFDIVSLFL